MSEKLHPNWRLLAESCNATSSITGAFLKVSGLPRDWAVRLGVALTLELDQRNGLYRPHSRYNGASWNLNVDDALAEAERRDNEHASVIFGEERPAEANMAVKVTSDRRGTYTLTADTRNELEDKPELGGGRLLQLGFIATVESIEL